MKINTQLSKYQTKFNKMLTFKQKKNYPNIPKSSEQIYKKKMNNFERS